MSHRKFADIRRNAPDAPGVLENKARLEAEERTPLDKRAGPGVPCGHCGMTLYRNEQSRQWVDDNGYVICPDRKHDHEPNLDDYDRGLGLRAH